MKAVCAPCHGLLGSAVLAVWLAGCASHAPAPVVERAPAAVAGAPAAAPVKDGYAVKKGDTLYSIALDHGVDYKDLAVWNGLDDPNRIFVGQVLRTTPPADAAASVAVVRPIVTAPAVEVRPLAGNTESLKRQPKAGKEAYSDEAYAQAQQNGGGAAATAVAKAETRAETKPEVKPEARAEARPADGGDEPAWAWPAGGRVLAGYSETGNKGVDILGKAGDPVLAAADGRVVYSGTGLRGYGQLVIVKHNATYLSAYAHNSRILVKEGQSVSRGQKIAEMGNTDADQVKLHFEVRRQGKPVDPLKYLPGR